MAEREESYALHAMLISEWGLDQILRVGPVAPWTEEGDRVRAERIDRVAALLEGHDRQPKRRNGRTYARVVIGPKREVADRIGVIGVEAQGEDEGRIGIEVADGVQAVRQSR